MIELGRQAQIEPIAGAGLVRRSTRPAPFGRYGVDPRNALRQRSFLLAGGAQPSHPSRSRRLPRVHDDPGRQGRRHADRPEVKKLRLRSFAAHPVQLKLVKSGAARVTAADIVESADVEVINPELGS